jgi:hypothetical protein
MMSLSKCNSNGSLSTSSLLVSFNATTGIATFSNLTISQKGMYTLLIDVKTVNSNDYNFLCMSTPVLVKGSSETILTGTSSTEPDIYLTFTGNYSSQSTDNIRKFQTMIYNCMLIKYGILLQRSISMYQGSVKAAIGTSGGVSSYSSLSADLNSSNFSLASDIVLVSAIINGQNYTYSNLAASDSSSGSSDVLDQKTAVIFEFIKQFFSVLSKKTSFLS